MQDTKRHYRAVFLSDIHLGTVNSNTDAVQAFLAETQCESLYLVGDIIDGWVGRKDRKWSQDATDVIRLALNQANSGCKVFYTPGNHDAFMRRMHGVELGNLVINHSFVHTLLDGRDLLVVHGDLFDGSVTRLMPLAWLGANMHEYLAVINGTVNKNRIKKGKRPVDFAAMAKKSVKKFIAKKTDYEDEVIEYAREHGFEGVVCGHVHRPRITEFPDQFLYINTGDWVEHTTAVVEHLDGRLELIWYGSQPEGEPEESAMRRTIEALKGLVSPSKPD